MWNPSSILCPNMLVRAQPRETKLMKMKEGEVMEVKIAEEIIAEESAHVVELKENSRLMQEIKESFENWGNYLGAVFHDKHVSWLNKVEQNWSSVKRHSGQNQTRNALFRFYFLF